jgi:beta-glucuronidase
MTPLLWIIILLSGAAVLVLLFFLWLFFPPLPLNPASRLKMPPSGKDWFTGKVSDIPFMINRGIPYPVEARAPSRRSLCLDGPWELLFEDDPDSVWEEVAVPSVFNAAEGGRTGYLGRVRYRRKFVLDALPGPGEQAHLVLRGALLRGTVYLNGREIGSFEGGYTPHFFDVGDALKQDNGLEVLLDNHLTEDSLPMKILEGHNPGWHTYGGLYRSVELHILPPHYLVKASCRLQDSGKVEIRALSYAAAASASSASSDLRGISRLKVLLSPAPSRAAGSSAFTATTATTSGIATTTLDSASSATATADGITLKMMGSQIVPGGTLYAWGDEVEVENLRLWSPEQPELYELDVRALESDGSEIDRIVCSIGFRDFAVRGHSFTLNGKPIFLKGICKHEDHPELGPVQTPELIETDLGLIKELGANYIRMAHYPHAVEELKRGAEMGFLLSEEIPLYQAGTGFVAWFQEKRSLLSLPVSLMGLRQISRPRLLDNARRQLIEMIERDRNNPAIVFWGVGNECYTLGRRSGAIFSRLCKTAKYFDPRRPVTNVELTYHKPPLDALFQGWKGMDICCLNSYFGWYYGAVSGLAPFLKSLERKRASRPLLLSEFGGDAAFGRHDEDGIWKAERVAWGKTYSEEYQSNLLKGYLQTAEELPWIAGVSPWVFSDFYNTWFPGNPVPNYNLKGIVSRYREPKAAYYTLQKAYRASGPGEKEKDNE